MLKKLILTTGFAALLGFAQAQQNDILPQGFAPGEEALIPAYMQSRYAGANDRATILTPPGGDIRTMAGWEELEALTITWTGYPAILREIVREAQTQCKVIIHCTDSNVVKTNLSNY